MRLARLQPVTLAYAWAFALAIVFLGGRAEAAGWVSPTGHSDSENKWTNESKAYDGPTSTYASDTSNRIGYGAWINFTLATPILSDRVRVNADFGYGVVNKVDIDVKRDGQWVDVWEGAVSDAQYTEKTYTAGTVSEVRFRFNYTATGYYFWLYEIGLWEAPAVINPPTVSTEDPSSIEATTAVFHGKVLDDGGSPCEVRFEYGPDTDFGTQTPWVGSHVSGDTFGKVITGLGSGTVFYRVQARNGEGTIVSGDDKSFATGTPQGGDWRSPTAHTDSSGTWENAEAAYDDETGTCARAYHAIGAGQWSQYLYLTRDALPNARGVRFMAKKDSIIDQISIDVLRNGVWTYVYAGTFSNMVWTTKGFSAGSVTQARVRFKVNSTSSGLYWELYEFDFTENPDLVPQAQSGDRYWIASSSGNWSSTANWSTTSGGAGGASVPGSTHLVHFNGSGLGTCTIDTNANVMGIDITPSYTGTISQGAGKTVTVGTLGFGQYGGTFSGGDAVFDCNGNFIVGGGTFTSTTGELRAAMNVTVSGTFAHNNGTVVLDGGSKTVSTGNAQFNTVVLNSPGGITVDGTMNIVNLTNTASNSQSTGVFAVSGNLVTTAQSLSSASATVLLNGSGNQTASANGGSGRICRIVVDKPSGVVTFLDNLKVVNGFSQLSGTVDASQGTITIADASAVIDTFDMTFGNLVFDTSGSVNISGTARAVNFSNLRSNNISGTLEVSGNVLTTSQSFSGAPGTLVLNGSGDQTISANGGSGKLPSIVIDKSSGGGSVILQDTLKIVGSFDFQFADGVNAGTSTVEFCGGSATLYGPSMSFATLVLNTQGNLTLDSDLSTTHLQILGANALNGEAIRVSGDVLTTASTMSSASATVRLVGSGAQNVGAGGGAGKLPNFEVEKTGGTANLSDVLQVNGNWEHISGTVNPGTSSVSFVGISTRSISGAAVFNNLMLNRSFIGETVNVESDVSVLGALDVIKGTLAIVEDNTLSVGGDLSIDATNGNLLANASTIAFDGTGAQAVDFGGRGVNNLTVSNAGGVVTFTSGVVAAEGSTATFLPGSSLKFANAQVFAFDLIDWKGAAGNPVTLRSDATGMPWFLEAAGYPSATYVDVQDSDASGGETIIATNSNDAGGNSNWAFQGAGLLSITTAATSVTNPAWVEGTSGSDAVSLQITVDEGDPFDAVRLNPTKWFGDDASGGGASLGVTISATQATHVEITATDALSNVNSVSQDITWAETDLSGKFYSTDTVKIRRGDSLLLTADGTGTTLEIDGDGDGTYESTGAPGDAFPTLYGTAGTYVARAKIDGAEVGSLTVVVIGVDLHGPVACELNWQRIQDTFVTPVTEVASVAFESANPFALTASFNQNTATGVRLNLKPLKMGTPQFLARLGSGGPIFGTQEVKVFILKNLNTAIAGVAMDENGFGEGAFRFQVVPPTVIANDDPGTPETEGLFFDFLVTGGFLTVKENGQSSIRVPSTAQDENGLFEIEVLYDPSGTSVCSRIHAVQVNSPDVDAGPEHHANPCITKVCKVVWFQEEVNDETSAADKARQQGNINAHSKRFHAHPPFVPQLEDGQDHTVMWSQGRQFVFAGEEVGSDYFAALISPPKRGPVEYDVLARCEREHCPRVPPCPQKDDDGASSHRMVSLKANPKDEVRAEIFYPFLVNEQMVGKATPGPTTFPHGTYFLSPPNWVGYNPGPEPHIDDPQICGPVPCPHPIDTCKKPIPCFGCNEYGVKYVNHWGTFDVHIGPNGICPKTDSPRIKDAITIIRLEAVGPKENEQQSGGFVEDPDGTVFPDLVGVVDQADIVRIDVSGGESAEIVQVTAPNEGTQSVVPAKTRKGIIENHTNDFTFEAILDPSFEIPEGATLTYSWDFGDGNTAEGESAFHSYETPGRYTVKLTLTIAVPNSDPIVATAELHSINIIQEECDNEQPHPGYLAEEDRAGVPVRILARGPAGATVNVALHVRRRADIGQKGLGRVSLDGYPEDEYKNGFTPETSAATVEGLTQYYSMTIDGQAHFPPENGSAGVDTESLGDSEMATWVVFLQGTDINDKADNIDLNVLGREMLAKCDSPGDLDPTCECAYTPTDWEAYNTVLLRFVTPLFSEELAWTGQIEPPPDGFVLKSDPAPQIELDQISASDIKLSQTGKLSIPVKGVVTDSLADIVKNNSADISSLQISNGQGSETTITLTRDQSYETSNASITRPYAYQSQRFEQTINVNCTSGSSNIIVSTPQNLAGQMGSSRILVDVDQISVTDQTSPQPEATPGLIRANITLLTYPTSSEIDYIRLHYGERQTIDADPILRETAENSFIFIGNAAGIGTVTVTITSLTALDSQVIDNITATIEQLSYSSTIFAFSGQFEESGPATQQFFLEKETGVTNSGDVNLYSIYIETVPSDTEQDQILFSYGKNQDLQNAPQGIALLETDVNSNVFIANDTTLGDITVFLTDPIYLTELDPAEILSINVQIQIVNNESSLLVTGSCMQETVHANMPFTLATNTTNQVSKTVFSVTFSGELSSSLADMVTAYFGEQAPEPPAPELQETAEVSGIFAGILSPNLNAILSIDPTLQFDSNSEDSFVGELQLYDATSGLQTNCIMVFEESDIDSLHFTSTIITYGVGADQSGKLPAIGIGTIGGVDVNGVYMDKVRPRRIYNPFMVELLGIPELLSSSLGEKGSCSGNEFSLVEDTSAGSQRFFFGGSPVTVFAQVIAEGELGVKNIVDADEKIIAKFAGAQMKLPALSFETNFKVPQQDANIPWEDVKLVPDEDKNCDIEILVKGLKDAERVIGQQAQWPIDIARVSPNSVYLEEPEPGLGPNRKRIMLDRVTSNGLDVVFRKSIDITTVFEFWAGDDGIREFAAIDSFAIGDQTEFNNELECDTMQRELYRKANYQNRGVAHGRAKAKNYDEAPANGLDEIGSEVWGRPISGYEFIKAAGVQKLVATPYSSIQANVVDGMLFERPGLHKGLDHMLVRDRADIFYGTGHGGPKGARFYVGTGFGQPNFDDLDDATKQGLKGTIVAVTPFDPPNAHNGKFLNEFSVKTLWQKGASADDPETQSQELEWFFAGGCSLFLEPTSVAAWKQAIVDSGIHGVCGYASSGWSGSAESKLFVVHALGRSGASKKTVANAWHESMKRKIFYVPASLTPYELSASDFTTDEIDSFPDSDFTGSIDDVVTIQHP